MSEQTHSSHHHAPGDEARIFGIPEKRLAGIVLFVVPLFFISNMIVARATADLFPPVALAFWRWFFAMLLMFCIAGPRLWVRRSAIKKEWPDLLLLGALGMGACGAFVYIAADTTTATNIGLIYAASPVLIILLAGLVYGETLRSVQLCGVAISLVGVLTIIARGDIAVIRELDFTVGDLWIVAAMVAWALYTVLLRYRPSEMGLTTRFAAITMGGVLVLLPFTIWEGMTAGLPTISLQSALIVAFLAVIPGFGAYQLYGFVQNALGAGRASVVLYLAPVYNAVLATLLLGEELAMYHIAGAALVLPGIYLSTRGGRK